MEKTVKTFVEVQADDIRKIGGTICEGDNGYTHFLCDTATANIEEILLRSILKCFGDDYRILAAEDFYWDDDEIQIELKTNFPWSLYQELYMK